MVGSGGSEGAEVLEVASDQLSVVSKGSAGALPSFAPFNYEMG